MCQYKNQSTTDQNFTTQKHIHTQARTHTYTIAVYFINHWYVQMYLYAMYTIHISIYKDVYSMATKCDYKCENLIRNVSKIREKRCTLCNDNRLN